MTAAASALPLAPRGAARLPVAELRALSRIEGRRLLRHPVFLFAAALTLLFFRDAGDGGTLEQFVGGFGWLPLASATLVVASLAALRSRRDGTDDLYGSLPRRRPSRTAGQLLAVLWTLPVSCAVLVAVLIDNRSADYGPGVPHAPGIDQLVQGPLMVVAFGAIGILLARTVPSVIAAPLLVVVLIALQLPGLVGRGWLGWALPTTTSLFESRPDTICDPAIGPGCRQVEVFFLGPLTWHVVYVAAMTLVIAAAALIPARRLPIAGLSALAVAIAVATKLAAG